MPWVPKSGAPDSFDLQQAFYALVHGEPAWEWVSKWSFLAGLVRWDTAAFCAAGPPPDVDVRDFPYAPGPLKGLASALMATDWGRKIQALQHQRVFYAYCTNTDPSGGAAVWYEVCRAPVSGGSAHTVTLDCPSLDSNGSNYRTHEHYTAANGTWVATSLNLNGAQVQNFGSGPVENPLDNYHVAAGPFDQFLWYIDDTAGTSTVTGFVAIEKFGIPPVGDVDPPDVPDPPVGADPYLDGAPNTLETIGEEVRRIEWKLDAIMSLQRWQTESGFAPSVVAGAASDEGPDVVLDLVDALGVMCEVLAVPPEADLNFGTPPRYWHLAQITLATDEGYMAPVDVPTSPFVIRPLPSGTLRAIATTWPGGVLRLTRLEPIT